MNQEQDPFFDEPPRKRFHLRPWIAAGVVLVVAAGVWDQIDKRANRVQPAAAVAAHTIRVWAMGASETFGQGAGVLQSWPMQFAAELGRAHPTVKCEARNLATAGVNTSEALQFLKAALRKVVDGEPSAAAGDDQLARPDYAILCFGVNNIWNLHAATELVNAGDSDSAGLHKAMRMVHAAKPRDLATTPRQTYYLAFSGEGGWRIFFPDFNDPFLVSWVRKDLQTIAQTLKENRIKPIFLTYYFDYFPELNTLIRKLGPEIGVPVIDVEHAVSFLVAHNWVMAQTDTVHLNKDGYSFVANEVVKQFAPLAGLETVGAVHARAGGAGPIAAGEPTK
jgi:lysophospholipase L1-like esterase